MDMLSVININDVAIIFILILLIPRLVEKHLIKCSIDREVRMMIVIGGMLWIAAAPGSDILYQIMGLVRGTDGGKYASLAYSSVLPELEKHNYGQIVRGLLSTGIWFYIICQSIFYYVTGGTVISLIAINCFLAFWGGLALTRLVYSLPSLPPSGNRILPILLIFVPSVVFWSCSSLKEALMYWSICHVYAFVMPSKSPKQGRWSFVLFIIAAFVGAGIRGHIILFWVFSVLIVKMWQKSFWKWGVVLLFIMPLFLGQVRQKIRLDSFRSNIEFGERYMGNYIRRDKPSTFDYGERDPILVLDGAVNTLFRPVPWRFPNLRSVLSSIEIWAISVGIIFLWMRMSRVEWRRIFRNPAIWVALLVCIPFFAFFTYTVNEGLLVRQRIQLYPALLVLLATPILLRQRVGSMEHGEKQEREALSC